RSPPRSSTGSCTTATSTTSRARATGSAASRAPNRRSRNPVAALRAGRRQRVLDEARERLVEPAEVLLTESRPRKVVLRRRRAECHVGKAGGYTVRGRLALTVRQPCEQQRLEAKRLLARRGLHQLRVLPPESVTQLDSAALHLEHQQAAPGLGDDEV